MAKKIFIMMFLLSFQLTKAQNIDSTTQEKGFFSAFNKGGYTTLILNQISFMNWAKGGENTVAATGILNLFANFKKKKFEFENTIDIKYGLQTSEEFGFRTNQDMLDISSKLGYKALDKFYYTGLLNFKSQFAPGYNYPNDSLVVSRFLSPAYLIISLGMDFKPIEEISVYLSPMTGKFIFVNNQKIADAGTFTGEPATKDTAGNIIKQSKTTKSDFGAYLRINYKKELMENITLTSKLEIFNNYTDKIIKNRSNFDIDSETSVVMKVNELISANIFLHFIYDHDINVPIYEKIDGQKTQVGSGPRLQMKEVLGIGISYYFK
jgi:hypothetical protein